MANSKNEPCFELYNEPLSEYIKDIRHAWQKGITQAAVGVVAIAGTFMAGMLIGDDTEKVGQLQNELNYTESAINATSGYISHLKDSNNALAATATAGQSTISELETENTGSSDDISNYIKRAHDAENSLESANETIKNLESRLRLNEIKTNLYENNMPELLKDIKCRDGDEAGIAEQYGTK